jgi:signal transduction histidine kinase
MTKKHASLCHKKTISPPPIKKYLISTHRSLFFNANKTVLKTMDEQIWTRTRIYMCTAAMLVSVWGVFDVFIDFENLWFFLALRALYTPVTLLWACFFHLPIFKQHHHKWALLHYILLITDIGIMVLYTDEFLKYLIGFSTIFWGASVIMLWRFWNTLVPGLIVIAIAWARFTWFPHNISTEELITGLYYFFTCLIFVTVNSVYGYRTAYLLAVSTIELKKTQSKLIKKQASMKIIVAGVAHEMNTPIGTAMMASSHAERQIDQLLSVLKVDEVSLDALQEPALSAKKCLQATTQELERTAQLLEKFSQTAIDLSQQQRKHFDLPAYINNNVINNSLYAILKTHNLEIVFAPNSATSLAIDSYPGLFSQIIINLVMNSIIHGFEPLTGDRPPIIRLCIMSIGDNINLHYSDNGQGMSPGVLKHIFDPFFTTKGTMPNQHRRGHQGSGLGMSIVYNIVTQQLMGDISAESQENVGSTFIIRFPRHHISLNSENSNGESH